MDGPLRGDPVAGADSGRAPGRDGGTGAIRGSGRARSLRVVERRRLRTPGFAAAVRAAGAVPPTLAAEHFAA